MKMYAYSMKMSNLHGLTIYLFISFSILLTYYTFSYILLLLWCYGFQLRYSLTWNQMISFIMLNEHSTIGMTSSMVDSSPPLPSPTESCLSPQYHFKKNLFPQIQCWRPINCGRAFVWEMTYPLQSWGVKIFFL